MGTRCITYVYDRDGDVLVTMLTKYNGYMAYFGYNLAEYLNGIRILKNNEHTYSGKYADGPGCLAAQIIAYIKDGAGNDYLISPPAHGELGEEYVYHIRPQGTDVTIEVCDPVEDTTLFFGSPQDLIDTVSRQFEKQSA